MTEDDFRFRLGIRDKNAPNHWCELSLDHDFSKRKTVLILPGSGVNEKKDANGMCKVVEKMLPHELKDKYDICSLYFPKKGERREYAVERALMLADSVFAPLVSQRGTDGELYKINAEKAASNLRNIKIFTHCYGSYMVETLDKEMRKLLQRLGYTEAERQNIQKQLIVFHNNDISYNVGREEAGFTSLIRISQSDEKARIYEYKEDSFPYYALTEKLTSEEALYIRPSENERVLLVQRITPDGKDEHNGAYWNDEKKSIAGEKEEILFNLIFCEALRADYPPENLEQLIRKALLHNPEYRDTVEEILIYGKEFSGEFLRYRQDIRKEYAEAKEKLLTGRLSSGGIKKLSDEALMTLDKDDKMLLDFAVAQKNPALVSALWSRMSGLLPARYAPVEDSLQNLPYNYSRAKFMQKRYLQEMLNTSQPEMFKALAKGFEELPRLNYGKADNATLLAAAGIYGSQPLAAALQDRLYFYKTLVYMYARCEKMPPDKENFAVRKLLEKHLFSREVFRNRVVQREIEACCRHSGAEELRRKCLSQWSEKRNFFQNVPAKKSVILSAGILPESRQ